MDLKTIDTADGIERAEGSSLCTALCNYVYDALKDKDYCCKDPFGEVRCGNRRINICYVSGEAANITHVSLAICLNNMLFADNKRGMKFCWTDMYDDVMAAAKQAAAKHSARVFAPKQVLGTVPRIQTSWPSMSKNAYSNAKPDSLPRVEKTYVAKFSFAFYRTSYYADKDIPDSKIIWDAFCRQREEHFRLHKADKAIMQPVYKLKYSDYGRLFSYIETTYCIKGIDKNSLSIGVSLRQMDGKEPARPLNGLSTAWKRFCVILRTAWLLTSILSQARKRRLCSTRTSRSSNADSTRKASTSSTVRCSTSAAAAMSSPPSTPRHESTSSRPFVLTMMRGRKRLTKRPLAGSCSALSAHTDLPTERRDLTTEKRPYGRFSSFLQSH